MRHVSFRSRDLTTPASAEGIVTRLVDDDAEHRVQDSLLVYPSLSQPTFPRLCSRPAPLIYFASCPQKSKAIMSSDKDQLLSMGFDPARIDCEFRYLLSSMY